MTLEPEGIRVVQKGKRKRQELSWAAFVSGDAVLAVGPRASLDMLPPRQQPAQPLRA